MAIREHLVNGAVALLQSAEVSYAPQDQKIAFLKAKNLSTEEIDLAFQRASASAIQYAQQPQQQYMSRPPQYGHYNYAFPPHPNPPPEPPRRDWRDWFIMATVIGGVGYAAATLAKRYVVPLIAPPTPAVLEQDKSAIDASFDKTFALLDQVVADTEALKTAEQSRTERLDGALREVEAVLAQLKIASVEREKENTRLGDDVAALKKLVPKAIKSQEENVESKLKELGVEVRGLKTLLASRGAVLGGPSKLQTSTSPSPATSTPPPQPSVVSPVEMNADRSAIGEGRPDLNSSAAGTSTYDRLMNGRAAIPAWQMAAAAEQTGASGSGSGSVDGAVSKSDVQQSQPIASSG